MQICSVNMALWLLTVIPVWGPLLTQLFDQVTAPMFSSVMLFQLASTLLTPSATNTCYCLITFRDPHYHVYCVTESKKQNARHKLPFVITTAIFQLAGMLFGLI